ncbi:MAG TPA: S8 family serine peptidase, partial [Myxococcaceae bacterium]|nr:S8 family serine peptidase [Myxococcaceae bacterium]
DGAGWNTWQVKDSLADGRNWGLEAISAPLAWGCELGGGAGSVAVVDTDFHVVTDLLGRVSHANAGGVASGALNLAQDSGDHGTRVTSVIAATGNDTSGMTGVLWRAMVSTYEIAVKDSATGGPLRYDQRVVIDAGEAISRLVAAAEGGASVINLSLGVDWNRQGVVFGYISPGGTYDPQSEQNAARIAKNRALVEDHYFLIRRAMTLLRDSLHKNPLVVMSAGNGGTNTRWDGWKIAADSFPQNVIVVGGVERESGGRLSPLSGTFGGTSYRTNYGSQVQITAPGENVEVLSHTGQVELRHGTSFAAPYVTGVAGLLLSFDPRLEQQAGTLKQLILEGARRGGRRVRNGSGPDSVPVLHAYNSLRAAAERPGAPLCGNRVLLMLDTMIVQRGTTMERVVVPGSGFNSGTEFFHGGRWMRKSGGATFSFSVQANQWISTMASPPTGHTLGDHTRFRRLTSHDGDTTFYGSAAQSSESTDPIRIFRKVGAGPGQLVGEIDERPVRSGTLCGLRSETSCWINEVGYEETAGPSLAYPSRGDSLLIFVARNYVRTTADGGEYHCGMLDVTSLTCQKATQERGVIHTRVYKMSLSTGGSRVIWTVPDTTVQAVAAHESGGEIATWARYTRIIAKLTPAVQLGRWTGTRPVEVVTCRQDYRNAADGSLALRGLEDPNCSGLAIYAP